MKKKIAIAATVVLVVCLMLGFIHSKTAVINEDYYTITSCSVESKGSRTNYYICVEGDPTPIRCSQYEYLYLSNPRMFDKDITDNSNYKFNISYKKYNFPKQYSKLLVIKDRVEKQTLL